MTLLFFFFNKTKQNISQLLFLCWPNLHWIYLCSNTIPVIVIKYSLSQIFYLYDKKSFFPKRFILWVKTFKHSSHLKLFFFKILYSKIKLKKNTKCSQILTKNRGLQDDIEVNYLIGWQHLCSLVIVKLEGSGQSLDVDFTGSQLLCRFLEKQGRFFLSWNWDVFDTKISRSCVNLTKWIKGKKYRCVKIENS